MFSTLENVLSSIWVDRVKENLPLRSAIFRSDKHRQPLAILFQKTPENKVLIIEWIYLSSTLRSNITTIAQMLAALIQKIRWRGKALLGMDPLEVIVPMPLTDWENLIANSECLQLALEEYVGTFDCHMPKDFRIQGATILPIKVKSILAPEPIKSARTVFTDGSKNYGVVTWFEGGDWKAKFTPEQTSAQRSELAAVILALKIHAHEPINLIIDSLYVFGLLNRIEGSYISPNLDSDLWGLFISLQMVMERRSQPLYTAHIRSHQNFPGFLSEGNAQADGQLKTVCVFSAEAAIQSHTFQSLAQALSNEIWQMDVTVFQPFAPWNKLHVCIDTYSGSSGVQPLKASLPNK